MNGGTVFIVQDKQKNTGSVSLPVIFMREPCFPVCYLQCVHDLNDSGNHHCDAENEKQHSLPLCHCHLPHLLSSSLSVFRNLRFLSFLVSLAAFTMSDEGCAEKFPGFSDISKKLFGGTQFVENTVAKEIKLTVKCKRTARARRKSGRRIRNWRGSALAAVTSIPSCASTPKRPGNTRQSFLP